MVARLFSGLGRSFWFLFQALEIPFHVTWYTTAFTEARFQCQTEDLWYCLANLDYRDGQKGKIILGLI
jgi:hypothetical protein